MGKILSGCTTMLSHYNNKIGSEVIKNLEILINIKKKKKEKMRLVTGSILDLLLNNIIRADLIRHQHPLDKIKIMGRGACLDDDYILFGATDVPLTLICSLINYFKRAAKKIITF